MGVDVHAMTSVFGQRLRGLRLERRMRQDDIAEAVGVTKCSVSQREAGRRTPGLDVVAVLAQLLCVSVPHRRPFPSPTRTTSTPRQTTGTSTRRSGCGICTTIPGFSPCMRSGHYVMGLDPGAADDDKRDILRDMLSFWAWRDGPR